METTWHSKDEYPVKRKGIIMYVNKPEEKIIYEVSPDKKDAFDWLTNYHDCTHWCYEEELLEEIRNTIVKTITEHRRFIKGQVT